MGRLAALAFALAAVHAAGAEPALDGPKRAVVVDKFSSNGQFDAVYGTWDVGGGLAAMLTTALQQSGRFVVLERANMGTIIFEQELKANNVANPETGPKLGQVAAAQFIVVGAVTEFGVQDKGGSFNIGVGVAQTVKVKEPISQTSYSASVDYKAMNMGGDQFDNTPLGEASRKAIDHAVSEIIATAAREPWHALLVDYDGKEAVINAGRNAGVKPGDHFNVQRIMQRLTDPATGEVLSVKRVTLGTLEVTNVEDKVAFATFATAEGNQPVRGDLVTSR